jgi:hypothetical protein
LKQCDWEAAWSLDGKETWGILKHPGNERREVGAFGVLTRCKKTVVGDGSVGYDDEQVVDNYAASKLIDGILCPYHGGDVVLVKSNSWTISITYTFRRWRRHYQ